MCLGNLDIRIPFSHCIMPLKLNFVAASQGGQDVADVLYLCEILRDFYQPQHSPTIVYEDILACVAMSEKRKEGRRPCVASTLVLKFVATSCANELLFKLASLGT